MEINCFSHRDNKLEIYVDATGNVFPCCFIGSILYERNIKFKVDNNLNNRSLLEILNDDVFDRYPSQQERMCVICCSGKNLMSRIYDDKNGNS